MNPAASPASVAVRAVFPRLEDLDQVVVERIVQLAAPRARAVLHVLAPTVCVFVVWWLIADGVLYLPVRHARLFGYVTGGITTLVPLAAFLLERAAFRRACVALGVDRGLLREIERRVERVDRLSLSGAAREQALRKSLRAGRP